jgi:ubiquinone/menaquinone biosynthesis C-methylase UbiE
MRDQALRHADLQKTHTAIDVGAGTGFTSAGVIGQVKSLTMLDQSHAQLSKAVQKPELQQALKLVGDAENLVTGKRYGDESVTEEIGKYDRYTSAGSIEYWPHPEQGILEAFRVFDKDNTDMVSKKQLLKTMTTMGETLEVDEVKAFFAGVEAGCGDGDAMEYKAFVQQMMDK